MNKLLILLILASTAACTNQRQEPSDDYVLIEFASKLEEDYEKLEKTSKK